MTHKPGPKEIATRMLRERAFRTAGIAAPATKQRMAVLQKMVDAAIAKPRQHKRPNKRRRKGS